MTMSHSIYNAYYEIRNALRPRTGEIYKDIMSFNYFILFISSLIIFKAISFKNELDYWRGYKTQGFSEMAYGGLNLDRAKWFSHQYGQPSSRYL